MAYIDSISPIIHGNAITAAQCCDVESIITREGKMESHEAAIRANDRDAVIFISGLVDTRQDQTAVEVARRMAAAMNRQAASGEAAFVISEGNDEPYGSYKTQKVTIARRDREIVMPILDLYSLNYPELLTGALRRRNVFWLTMSLALTLLSNFGRVLRSLRKPGKTIREKFQFLFVLLIFLVIALYMLLLILTLAATVIDGVAALSGIQSSLMANLQDLTEGNLLAAAQGFHVTPKWLYYMQVFAIITGAFGIFTKFDLTNTLAAASSELASTLNYLTFGENATQISGQFSALLEHIHEKANEDVRYHQIHVVAFSFGSIVAIDSLFSVYPTSDRLSRIHTFVSIGSPFDIIRTYFPDYFINRCTRPDTPARWFNIYEMADVLGSNFLDEDRQGQTKPHGIRMESGEERIPESIRFGKPRKLEDYSLFEQLALVGLQSHTRYWVRGSAIDINCFDIVVQKIYQNSPALS
jgi:hypothetical protein